MAACARGAAAAGGPGELHSARHTVNRVGGVSRSGTPAAPAHRLAMQAGCKQQGGLGEPKTSDQPWLLSTLPAGSKQGTPDVPQGPPVNLYTLSIALVCAAGPKCAGTNCRPCHTQRSEAQLRRTQLCMSLSQSFGPQCISYHDDESMHFLQRRAIRQTGWVEDEWSATEQEGSSRSRAGVERGVRVGCNTPR